MNTRLSVLSVLAVVAFASACSTAPEQTTIVEKKNQAAEYSKLADEFFSQGALDSALLYYGLALETNSAVDNVEGVATSHNSIGRVYLVSGDKDSAESEFNLAKDYALISQAPGVIALAYSNLGETAYAKGDIAAAIGLFEKALPYAEKDERALAVVLHNRGVIKRAQGALDAAEQDFRRAAEINARIKRFNELASNHYMIASIAVKRGDDKGALASLMEALEADKKVENSGGITQDLISIAQTLRRMGRASEAYDYFRRAFGAVLTRNDAAMAKKVLTALEELAGELGYEDQRSGWRKMLDKLSESGTK